MKRQTSSLLITILLFASLGAFAAVVKLFPDIASDMPLVPRGSGTLTDSFLALIGKNDPKAIATSTGIVQNAVQLGGFSGSQYVRVDSACSDPLKPVWVSVDAAGKPICGSKSSPGLVYLGTISEVGPGVSIYQASGSIIAATVGAKLYNGDTIDTGTNGKTTVLFTDRSLIRLKENTTVTLDVGKYAGTSIANVILGRGDLWGRVLAENGQYDVGTIDIVAAVRGTSFSLQKGNVSAPRPEFTGGIWNFHFASGNPATLIVVDTVNPNTAVEARCTEPNSRSYPLQAPERGNNILYGCSGQSEKKTNTQLYTESAWLRENTRADITYMNGLKSKSEKVTNEQALSEPTDAEKNPLCLKYNGVENGVWFTPEKRCVFAYADYTTGRDEMILANVSVTPLGWRYADGVWKLREPLTSYALNPGEKGYRVYLKDPQNTLSTSFDTSWKRTSGSANMAMNPNGAMLIGSVSGVASSASGCMEIIGRKTGANNESYCTTETNWVKFPVPVLSEGISIMGTGQYVNYNPQEFLGSLGGKRFTMIVRDTIPNVPEKRYLIHDKGNNLYFIESMIVKDANTNAIAGTINSNTITINSLYNTQSSTLIFGNNYHPNPRFFGIAPVKSVIKVLIIE